MASLQPILRSAPRCECGASPSRLACIGPLPQLDSRLVEMIFSYVSNYLFFFVETDINQLCFCPMHLLVGLTVTQCCSVDVHRIAPDQIHRFAHLHPHDNLTRPFSIEVVVVFIPVGEDAIVS